MPNSIYTFNFAPNWMQLTNEISQIDRFDASWTTIEKREGQTLKQLKSIATTRSVGASTRIEGSRMTDDEVEVLINNLDISRLEERDQQEVASYFETMELIAESFKDIDVTENNLKHLHNSLMKYSTKDAWHKGNYKQHSNVVQAGNPDGSTYVIFKTTNPGFATEDAIANLIAWYKNDIETLPLIKAAVFVYDFLSIHPFQDGNGRLSRLLGTLLLLKYGYSWIQYVSFEHEIENRKTEYYKILMECQRQRPGEDVYPWVMFFLDCLKNIQNQLISKLEVQKKSGKLTLREKKIYSFVENHTGSKSGEIAKKLDIPLPTVKRIIADMVQNKLLAMHGAGAATNYSIEGTATIKKDLVIRLTNDERRKELLLTNQSSSIEIKSIILTPLFEWSNPNEWSSQLTKNGLYIKVTCVTGTASTIKAPPILINPSLYHFRPTIILSQPINIPADIWEKVPYKKDFPIQVTIALIGAKEKFDFDVMLVYDEA
ncbi:MAG: Fic family protein [Bacteroidetes bacterium]|nr:Fic family protein [Bacteroidota bacterium]